MRGTGIKQEKERRYSPHINEKRPDSKYGRTIDRKGEGEGEGVLAQEEKGVWGR